MDFTPNRILSLSVSLTLALLPALPLTAAGGDAWQLLESERPLVIGHRGYATIAPENTLVSFRFAAAAGADLVELDYHVTKDGVPVVIHDYTLDRTTDARQLWGGKDIKVVERDMGELRQLNAAAITADYGRQPLSTLGEALDAIQPFSITLIERKAGEAAPCIDLLRQKGLINEVVVQSFDWDYIRAFHELEPGQLLAALGPQRKWEGRELSTEEQVLSPEWVNEVAATGARVAAWNRNVSTEAVTAAHERGLDVWVYTIDDPAEARRLLDMGVDGIITNNPGLIWRTVAERAGEK